VNTTELIDILKKKKEANGDLQVRFVAYGNNLEATCVTAIMDRNNTPKYEMILDRFSDAEMG